MTQSQVADAIGIQRATVNGWEAGRAEPRPEGVRAVLRVLGLDVFDLYRALDAVEGKPPLRLRPLEVDAASRDKHLLELLGLAHLPAPQQELFITSLFELRNLVERTTRLERHLAKLPPPEPGEPA